MTPRRRGAVSGRDPARGYLRADRTGLARRRAAAARRRDDAPFDRMGQDWTEGRPGWAARAPPAPRSGEKTMDGLMQGKAVVVTGAGRGLGEAFAVHVARAGGSVFVYAVDAVRAEPTASSIRAHAGRAVASAHSVAEAAQAQEIVDLCVKEF